MEWISNLFSVLVSFIKNKSEKKALRLKLEDLAKNLDCKEWDEIWLYLAEGNTQRRPAKDLVILGLVHKGILVQVENSEDGESVYMINPDTQSFWEGKYCEREMKYS